MVYSPKRMVRLIMMYVVMTVTLALFFSCQKEISTESGTVVVTPPDLSTRIKSSVSGFVTDENDAPVLGATVQVGTTSIATDKYGYFEVKNVSVVKTAATVAVSKAGYFKGIKTYMGTEGKGAFFRIKLVRKTNVGTINANTGGNVTLSNGLTITLPAGGIVNATTNAVYTGTVNVAANLFDITSPGSRNTDPGDDRGIEKDGSLKLIQGFGMASVELTGASGELLQIKSGLAATLTIPIPASLTATAPLSIKLWSFDEALGLWKEEGTASKSGNNYVAIASHFSYWYVGIPGPYVQFDCTFKDPSGNPLPYIGIDFMSLIGNPYGLHNYGYSDNTGYVGGPIPANNNLVFYILSYPFCTFPNPNNLTTTNANVSLGDVIIAPDPNWIHVTGTVVDCNNTAVPGGHIVIKINNQYLWRYDCNASGNFNFSWFICSGVPLQIDVIGVDGVTLQEGSFGSYTLNYGNNNLGNIVACGNNAAEFIDYTINSINYSHPFNNYYGWTSTAVDSAGIYGSSNTAPYLTAWASFTALNIGANSVQNLYNFSCTEIPEQTTLLNPISVHITEYGNVGQFMSGNFSGTLTGIAPPFNSYAVTANFRVRRQ